MLKLADLAARGDFDAGPLHISPARRLVEGPGGSSHLEPIVMKVLLLLLDAAGDVVTRDELFGNAWGSVFVGDDSLNRAIGQVRKVAHETAPGLVEIEAIPRTGYRLTGELVQELREPAPNSASFDTGMPRRRLLASGAAAAALLGAGGIWWADERKSEQRFEALMDQGNDALRLDREASNYFRKAVAIEPKSATAWGLLAYSLANGVYRSSKLTGENAAAADKAARKSLAIDANEPHALLALGFIQNGVRDWYSREQSLRHILEIAPDNPLALRSLGQFLHAVGRCIESLAVVERALTVQPLAPDNWLRKAGRLWVLGDVAEADHVIDRAMQLWPWHPVVRLIRLMIYAFTGRPQAALTMIDAEEKTPTFMSRAAAPAWRTSLFALERPTTAAKAAARKASLEGSQGSLQVASSAVLLMSALGELDAAFEIASGYLLDRGSIIVRPRSDARLPRGNDPSWRNTFGLFTPPTKAMRLDPRFKSLADGVGLTEYWQKRRIGPDGFLFRA